MVQLILVFSVALVLLSPLVNGSPKLHSFMYKYCSTSELHDDPNGMFSNSRQNLVDQLLPRSSHSRFYRAAVIPDDQPALWGHFQCRGDLTSNECHKCVKSLSGISSNTLCAKSLSARIQLYGCHLQYEADGSEIPSADLTHKTCGEESDPGEGFEEAMSEALGLVESGVMESPNGYSAVDVRGVYATAQCGERMRGCDCGECVAKAARAAEEDCVGAISGHVYMDFCSLSFEFRPEEGQGRGIGSLGMLLAIAVGGLALLFIGFLLLKKCYKKDDG